MSVARSQCCHHFSRFVFIRFFLVFPKLYLPELINIYWMCLDNTVSEIYDRDDHQPDATDVERSATSCRKRTDPTAAAQYLPMKLSLFQHEEFPYHRPRVQPKMKQRVDAEVGKAHHMRVARRRHDRSRRYPASVNTTPQTLTLPLTHPQPC